MANLDPLGADAVMARLASANDRADADWMMDQALRLAARSSVSTPAEARAALRDLGFLVASAARHEPGLDLSALEPALRRLGALADEVPRDTVYSYATRNPRGARRRSFTGTAEEQLFIDNVAGATIALNHAVESLNTVLHTAAAGTPECEQRLVEALRTSRRSVETLRTNLLHVKRQVSPEVFSHRLRPYFPDLTIGGQRYEAPGGAQMPLLALDVLLFAHRAHEPGPAAWHQSYLDENLRYLPPAHRAVCAAARALGGGASVAGSARTDGAREEFAGLLRDVLRFRHPHRQLARDNMRVRPQGSLGSGGYTDAVLDRMIEVNRDALQTAEGGG